MSLKAWEAERVTAEVRLKPNPIMPGRGNVIVLKVFRINSNPVLPLWRKHCILYRKATMRKPASFGQPGEIFFSDLANLAK